MNNFIQEINGNVKYLFSYSKFKRKIVSFHIECKIVLWCLIKENDVFFGLVREGRTIEDTWTALFDYGISFLNETIMEDYNINEQMSQTLIESSHLAVETKELYVKMLDKKIKICLERKGVDFNKIDGILVYDELKNKLCIEKFN